MVSAFTPYQNAELRFQISSGALEVDSETGNITPSNTVVTVMAILNQKRAPNKQPLPGVDSTAVYLEGYVTEVVNATTNPLLLPDIITPSNQCQLLWDNKSGQFFMELVGRSAYGVAPILGDKLKGYFQISDFTVDGDEWDGTIAETGVPTKLVRELLTISITGQTVFTLSFTAQSPQLSELTLNGVKTTYPTEYSINSNQLTWLDSGQILNPTDDLEIVYYKA